jgi:hypothetical protein
MDTVKLIVAVQVLEGVSVVLFDSSFWFRPLGEMGRDDGNEVLGSVVKRDVDE